MQEKSPVLAQLTEAALFGFDPMERIVSVEPLQQGGMAIYRRLKDGTVQFGLESYRPWFLMMEKPDFPLPGASISELEGDGFRCLLEFPTHELFQSARTKIRERILPNTVFPSGARMALIRSGKTLFKNMVFDEVVRMQFDLETNGLDPAPEDNRILLIVVSDNRGLLEVIEGDEADLIERFVEIVREQDPDVLEGHNIYGFDLPFLLARANRHGVMLTLGRDGSEMKSAPQRDYAIGGAKRPFIPYAAHGRQFIDTYLVVQRFDWAKGALSSYGLKECARHYGFAREDRVELPRDKMVTLYRDQPEIVLEYARQDAEETRLLAELICPVEFYQTQMIPDNYGQVAVSGSGSKINMMLVRAYLAAGRSIPVPSPAAFAAGGYTEIRESGVLDRVVKADVESLYPSLMLTNGIAPKTDTLGIFLPMLGELTRRRLDAKRRAASREIVEIEEEKSSGEKPDSANLEKRSSHEYWDGLQNSFKVLINSFYGYLGAAAFAWNDPQAAGRVTELGRALVQKIAEEMTLSGSKVIEIDTDGVYFTPPLEILGEEAERAYIAGIAKTLPEGIRLAFDGRYARMLSLKTKNYVLETYSGKRIIKGASLRSRADERYGRRFLEEAIDCMLRHDIASASKLYLETVENLLQRRVPIEDLIRRERVTSKTFQSSQKRRSATVAQGVAVGDHVWVYEKSDGTLALKEDYNHDENVAYYMGKLYKFAHRLEAGVEGDFKTLFPKPSSVGIPHKHQTLLDFDS